VIRRYTTLRGNYTRPVTASLRRKAPMEKRTTLKPFGDVHDRKRDQRKAFRAEIMQRDRHTCQRCGGEGTDAHHLLTKGSHIELEFDPRNLLLLCRSCHQSAHRDPAVFNRWAADEFPRFRPLYAQFGKGDGYETWAGRTGEEE
jgi:5-methylcytosine-specific restriction endonuclease McrA